MNCKPGDLAVVVAVRGADQKNKAHIGKIVTAAERIDGNEWKTEPLLIDLEGYFSWISLDDSELRPIRDNDGEDETLQWAPVPTKETA
jgi:hypothetical protein